MKRYTSHKEVDAAKIIDFALAGNSPILDGYVLTLEDGEKVNVTNEWCSKHSSEQGFVGGYFVRYADGYESWSPAAAFESGYREITNEGHAALAVENENTDLIKHMTDRFLGWKLPDDFHPDAGISFSKTYNNGTEAGGVHEPVGTNLFTAQQAQEMFAYLLEGFNLSK